MAAWSVDRLGRSLQDLLGTLGELHAKDIGLYLHQQGLDTSTPAGKAMFQMIVSEFERAMIRERVMTGLKRAKANGTTLGRPKIDEASKIAARKALCSGKGIIKVAKELGLGWGAPNQAPSNEVLIHGGEIPVHCLAGRRDHGRPLCRRAVVRPCFH